VTIVKLLFILAGIFVVAFVVYVGCTTSRAGYQTAPYQVLKQDGQFELRRYPTLAVVRTPMVGADDSFMRLFRYIGGQNDATQKIAMTTPVFMTGDSMAFVLPEKMPAGQVPQPNHKQVSVASIPAGTFAVMRFSGSRNTQHETQAVATLTSWMQREKLSATGEPVFGYFDPPWTPVFLRRNEVMLRIQL
jgi:effector-binding domain-containing protein